ncbi:MAG: HPr family phosphocarrier protein [Sedimentisphaerales bacterium]|nr:HPr family phosphocarrier protein [Sedimentisphaerales bacterium]
MTEKVIDEIQFKKLISERSRNLMSLANMLCHSRSIKEKITRPFLGELLAQSLEAEELLDAYGAGHNCTWCRFRTLIAAVKGFSEIGYELLHVLHVLPDYHLLPTGKDFVKETKETLEFVSGVLLNLSCKLLSEFAKLEMSFVPKNLDDISFTEDLPEGKLPHLCERRHIEKVSETVILLATAFLNLAADSKDVRAAARAKPEEYASYVADSVSEEKMRSLQLRFHNLQSLYDTFVSGTEAADLDPELPVLRGHISVVLHLLRTATLFAHHYERHITKQLCGSRMNEDTLVPESKLLSVLMNYSIAHASLYIDCAVNLCQEKLKRYAEIGEVELPVPQYRGFHVRPSTLVAKLVMHYGSNVQMKMGDETYDAGSPLDLFRANEKINAQKRRWLTEEIVRLNLVPEELQKGNIKDIVLGLVLTLAGRAKLILYEQPLQLPEEPSLMQGTVLEKIVNELARLLAMGKIDVESHMTAVFRGDKRVINDIKVLAEAGYGEDKFGNNVPLPEKLAYLRR